MTTKRKTRLSLTTEASVHDTGRRRPVVIEWTPDAAGLLHVRLHGTRRRYPIDPAALYRIAVDAAIRRERAEKRKSAAPRRRGGA